MTYLDGQPSGLKKEEWLKETPVFQNTVLCEKVFSPGFTLSHLHFHEFLEISIVIGGSGMHCICNKACACKKGDVYIINAGVPHEYFAVSEKEQPLVHNLLFDAEDWFDGKVAMPEDPRYCYGIFEEDILAAYVALGSRSLEAVERICQSIAWEVEEKRPEWMDAVKAHLTVLLITMGRYLKETRSPCRIRHRDQQVVSAVMRSAVEHYAESGMTLEAIAESLFLSKSYLSKLFFKVTGGHFSEYLRSIRLEQACRLLRETRLTNEQIVYSCGLKDVPSFYRLFKSQFSMTPNQYRKKMQAGN